jgi:hypothetical protein
MRRIHRSGFTGILSSSKGEEKRIISKASSVVEAAWLDNLDVSL